MSLDAVFAVGLLACGSYLAWASTAVTVHAVQDAHELRLAVLTDPRSAITSHCRPSERRQPSLYSCDLTLAWRVSGAWRDVCTSEHRDEAAQVRPGRYWRIASRCVWHAAAGQGGIELPLLAAELFR